MSWSRGTSSTRLIATSASTARGSSRAASNFRMSRTDTPDKNASSTCRSPWSPHHFRNRRRWSASGRCELTSGDDFELFIYRPSTRRDGPSLAVSIHLLSRGAGRIQLPLLAAILQRFPDKPGQPKVHCPYYPSRDTTSTAREAQLCQARWG